MNLETLRRLEYDKIKRELLTYAMSYLGTTHIENITPLTDRRMIERLLNEVEEAGQVIVHGASVPIPALEGMESITNHFGKGFVLTVDEVTIMARFVESTDQLKRFLLKKESIAPTVCSYALSLFELKELRNELERCVRHGQITDQASNELAKIRKKIMISDDRIKKKLEGTMQKYKAYLQENIVSMRRDRYVIPVKKEHRKLIQGTVLDESSSGQTVFIEPSDVAALHQELSEYRMAGAREEARVLSYLTGRVEEKQHEISINLETIGYYDFLFAKAKYAHAMEARNVKLNEAGTIHIKAGRHPLLGRNTVPLDFSIGNGYSALIITGPNTGGKTVSLKTVGLLTLMVQSGLLVPVQEGSIFSVYTNILADIGDGQSIEQSLSTFSSHIKNVIEILNCADPSTLILLDELATGTDPGEGVGLSIAVLEELYKRQSTIVATTHYNEIKKFAGSATGFRNARMEFDIDTLQPLYRLRIGEAGESYAFFIAMKLGISPEIIARSKQITYREMDESQRPDKAIIQTNEDLTKAETPPASYTAASIAAVENKESKGLKGKPIQRKSFQVGDCVWIHSLKRTGIVCELPDARGDMIVMIQKEKVKINIKRLSLHIAREELYPGDDYDMDIVLESKDVRKKRKLMARKYVEGLTIVHPNDPS